MKLRNEIEDIIVDLENGDLFIREAAGMIVELCAKFAEENTNQCGDYDVGGDIAEKLRLHTPYSAEG